MSATFNPFFESSLFIVPEVLLKFSTMKLGRSVNAPAFSAPQHLVIIGQGPWGQALMKLWKPKFRSAVALDSESTPADWKQAFRDPACVVLACPFKAIRSLLGKVKRYKPELVINASKGIDPKSLQTLSAVAPTLVACPVLTVSGPTFAAEILAHKPAAAVLASRSKTLAKSFARMLSSPLLRLYASDDPQGVEACGALKNVLAIACGLSDGLGLGLNARAALLTRGLRELQILARFLGGKSETVFGLAGVGDLWLTATGDLSRNRQIGLKLAEGLRCEDAIRAIGSTCEVPYTLIQVNKIARRHHLDLPITQEIYAILFRGKNPRDSLNDLMTRELRLEETIVRPRHRRSTSMS